MREFHNGGDPGAVSRASRLWVSWYGACAGDGTRAVLRRWVTRLEGGELRSATLREIYRRFHGVDVGLYTLGAFQGEPGRLAPGTKVGRYSWVDPSARVLGPSCMPGGYQKRELFDPLAIRGGAAVEPPGPGLEIGNDVFIGHLAVLMPVVGRVGDGAVIGVGAWVSKEVPPYAVVAGNPGRIVRRRVPEEAISGLQASRWWEKAPSELGGEHSRAGWAADGVGVVRHSA